MSSKAFKLVDFKMQEDQRQHIMDMMRSVISKDLDVTESLTMIKKNLDSSFNGKWSVVYGSTFKTYLDPKIFMEYMWFQASNQVYLIFRKHNLNGEQLQG